MTLTNDGAGGRPSIWSSDPPSPGGPTMAGPYLSYGEGQGPSAGRGPGAAQGIGRPGWDDGWDDPRPPWRADRSTTPLGEQVPLVLGVGAGGVVVGMLLASILFLFVFNDDGAEEFAGTDGEPFAGGTATTAAHVGDNIASDPLDVGSNPLAGTDDALTDEGVGDDALTDDALTAEGVGDDALTDDALTDDALTAEGVGDDALTDDALTAEGVGDDMAGVDGDQTMATNPDGTPVADPNSTASTAPPSTAAPATSPPAPGAGGDEAAVQQQVLAITNQERAAAGCPALTLNAQLNAAADAHSEDMLINDYFDHTDLRGGAPWDRAAAAGYQGRGIGENIALGYSGAADVMDGWMNSPGHRANILNCSYRELGVGYARNDSSSGGFRQIYWTQLFGS